MKILHAADSSEYLDATISVLRKGGLVAAPTDTVYGLLADAENESAVRKLLAFKNRPAGKPISVFLSNIIQAKKYTNITSEQETLINQFIPGPYTIILPSNHSLAILLESEKGTLGIRIIDYPVINSLLNRYNSPLTATSANIAGKSPHHSFESFIESLSQSKKNLIDIAIDAGVLPRNKPSTVVDFSGSDVKILRAGDIVTQDQTEYNSSAPEQTHKIGMYILKKYSNQSRRPLVFIIKGELGVGKTILVKGIAEAFQIKNIISPTYVIYYEYPLHNALYKKFIHADLYNIRESEEFEHLGLENYLNEKNVVCFEWGEKIGKLYDQMKNKADIVVIEMRYKSENERIINVFR